MRHVAQAVVVVGLMASATPSHAKFCIKGDCFDDNGIWTGWTPDGGGIWPEAGPWTGERYRSTVRGGPDLVPITGPTPNPLTPGNPPGGGGPDGSGSPGGSIPTLEELKQVQECNECEELLAECQQNGGYSFHTCLDAMQEAASDFCEANMWADGRTVAGSFTLNFCLGNIIGPNSWQDWDISYDRDCTIEVVSDPACLDGWLTHRPGVKWATHTGAGSKITAGINSGISAFGVTLGGSAGADATTTVENRETFNLGELDGLNAVCGQLRVQAAVGCAQEHNCYKTCEGVQ